MDYQDPRTFQALMKLLQYAQAAQSARGPRLQETGGWKTLKNDPGQEERTGYMFPASKMVSDPGRFVGPNFAQSQREGTPYYSRPEQREWAKTGMAPEYDEVAREFYGNKSGEKAYGRAQTQGIAQSESNLQKYMDEVINFKPEPYVPRLKLPENYHSGAGRGQGNAYYGPGAGGAALSSDVPVSADEKSNWFAPRAPAALQNANQNYQADLTDQAGIARQGRPTHTYSDYVPAPQGTQDLPAASFMPGTYTRQQWKESGATPANRGGSTIPGDILDYLLKTLVPGTEQTRQNVISGQTPIDFSYYFQPGQGMAPGSVWDQMFGD